MTVRSFSFAEHADGFDQHIGNSIPGYSDLCGDCAMLSRRFVQDGTTVVDIGCTTGTFIRKVHDANEGAVTAQYLGLDHERTFTRHWAAVATQNVGFRAADVLTFDGLKNMSFASSLFTLQFIPQRDRVAVLRKVYDGMIDGGGLVIAEKTLANSARLQDILAFQYYDLKRPHFSAEEILVKEQRLRRSDAIVGRAATARRALRSRI